MSGKNVNFEGKKINKSKVDDIDVNKMLVSELESYAIKSSLKYFIGYNDNDVIRLLCIKLPKMIGFVKCFDSNHTMSLKVNDKKLLQNYIKIWERVSNLMNTELESQPVYGDNNNYIKTKIKPYGDKVNTNCQGKKRTKRKFITQMLVIDNVRLCF